MIAKLGIVHKERIYVCFVKKKKKKKKKKKRFDVGTRHKLRQINWASRPLAHQQVHIDCQTARASYK
jgi:hypothetical protein